MVTIKGPITFKKGVVSDKLKQAVMKKIGLRKATAEDLKVIKKKVKKQVKKGGKK